MFGCPVRVGDYKCHIFLAIKCGAEINTGKCDSVSGISEHCQHANSLDGKFCHGMFWKATEGKQDLTIKDYKLHKSAIVK